MKKQIKEKGANPIHVRIFHLSTKKGWGTVLSSLLLHSD